MELTNSTVNNDVAFWDLRIGLLG